MINIILMITTKKIKRTYTQKWEGNKNVPLQKNQLNTKEGSKEANEGQKAIKQKTKNGNSESFYSNYYF